MSKEGAANQKKQQKLSVTQNFYTWSLIKYNDPTHIVVGSNYKSDNVTIYLCEQNAKALKI